MSKISKQIAVFFVAAIFLNLLIVEFCAFKVNQNEVQREKADVKTLYDMQATFSDVIQDEELWEYIDNDIIKYQGQVVIYIGNAKDAIQMNTIEKWYPKIYNELPVDTLLNKKFYSQTSINSKCSLYLIIYYDKTVKVMLSNDSKTAIGCNYIDDYFITD